MKSVEFCAAQVTAPKFHSIVRYAHRESRHPDTRLPSGLPENEEDGRLGEALRVTLAVVDVADNVRGELSAHVITVSKLDRKKIARPIECVGHDAQSVGIINILDAARCGHCQRAKIDSPLFRPLRDDVGNNASTRTFDSRLRAGYRLLADQPLS